MQNIKINLNVKEWLQQKKPELSQKLLVFKQFFLQIVKQVESQNVKKAIRQEIGIDKNGKLIFPSSANIKTLGTLSQKQEGIIYKHIEDPIQMALNFLITLISQHNIMNASDYCSQQKYYIDHKCLKGKNIDFDKYLQQIEQLIQSLSQQKVTQTYLQNQNKPQNLDQFNKSSLTKNNYQQEQVVDAVMNYIKQNRLYDALKWLESQKNKNWIISNAKGVINQMLKKYKQAEYYYRQALKQKQTFIVKKNLCSLFYDDNQFVLFHNGLEQLRSITKSDDEKIIINEFLADGLLKNKQYQKAYELLKIIEQNSQDMIKKIHYRMKIIQIFIYNNKYLDAIKNIESLKSFINTLIKKNTKQSNMTSTNPNSSSNGRTNLLSQTSINIAQLENENMKALQNYKQINEINYILVNKQIKNTNVLDQIKCLYLNNITSPLCNKVYAQCLLQNNQFQKAHDIYKNLYKDYKNDFEFHWNLATCNYQLQFVQCFQNLIECKRIQPNRIQQINGTIIAIKKIFQDKGIMKKCQRTMTKQTIENLNKIFKEANSQLRKQ